MSKSSYPSLVTLRLQAPSSRLVLLLVPMVAILASWFVVRWYVANTVAEYVPSVEEGGLEMARSATRWSPGDPLTHWRAGMLEARVFSASNLAAAVREHQLAVSASPNDFRYWMELGRALEANGDSAGAEKALGRAVELAPAYSDPRWYLGNLLVRQGNMDAAFEHLARAAEADARMRPQVLSLAWRVFGGDIETINRLTRSYPAMRVHLATHLLSVAGVEDAMRIWRTVNPTDRNAQREISEEFLQKLIEAKQFRASVEVMRRLEPDSNAAAEQIWNGGFESDLGPPGRKVFHWLINSRSQALIGIDSRGHTGKRSLRIVFRATNLDNIPVSQTFAVEPGTQYRFECYVRTEDLASASTPVIAILDATDNSTLGGTAPLPTGTSDWQRITFEFKTKPNNDGVTIGFFRAGCGEGPICPILGSVWYDDFNIQRIGSSGSSGADKSRGSR